MGAAFVTFIHFYVYLHEGHNVPAKTLDETARSERGDHAVGLAIDMQRAMLALIGTHRRRTYAHDLVYGTHQLYMLFGKPWNAATEGSEHAHQDMKKYFHNLACHGGNHARHGDTYQVLRLITIRRQTVHDNAHLLPHSGYAAMRANTMLQQQATVKEGKRRGCESGPKGGKVYAEKDVKMLANAARLQAEVVGMAD